MSPFEFCCNGKAVKVEARNDELLLYVLRDQLGLTGTKLGCGTGDCGACTVIIDEAPANACLIYVAECDGRSVATVEGVVRTPTGRIVAEELVRAGGVQCGICTPGFLITATAFLDSRADPPDRTDLQVALAGNLCRCTGYLPILSAVEAAGRRVHGTMNA